MGPDAALRRYWPLAVAYLVLGFAAYWRILGTFFVADDFAYLGELARTSSPAVIFSALAGRYFRPAVVFVYYVNYQLSGLAPWTYHASVVLVHVVNAWLVFMLGRAIAPERGALVPALAGALFLVAGSHAEAVTWIGGMADPLVTMFLLTALLCYWRGLESLRPAPYFAAALAAFAGALFSKESAAAFVGYVVAVTVLGGAGWPDRQRLRRAAAMLAALALVLAAYFALRRSILGFTFVNLDGLGTNANYADTAARFTLRAFFPNGSLLGTIWQHRLDLYVLAPAAAILLWLANRRAWRQLLLFAAFFLLAIAPIMPLSISFATPESERLIYLATAFSSLFTIWLVDAVVRKPAIVVAFTLVFGAWHLRALDRTNKLWVVAAALTRHQTTSFGELLRTQGEPGLPIFVLNLTDNVRGAYIWRRGFHDALTVTLPEQSGSVGQTRVLTVTQVWDENAPVSVTRPAHNAFAFRINSGSLAGNAVTTPLYALTNWSPVGFTGEFTEAAGRALVVYFTPWEAKLAGRLDMQSIPFGNIDLPAGELSCRAGLEIRGWALDAQGVSRISIHAADGTPDAPGREIAEAERLDRPDVGAAYPGYPDSSLAGWSFVAPCAAVPGLGAGTRLQVVATNQRGARVVIGSRLIAP